MPHSVDTTESYIHWRHKLMIRENVVLSFYQKCSVTLKMRQIRFLPKVYPAPHSRLGEEHPSHSPPHLAPV